ncbi:MAG: hypothetical protein KOO69_03635, partial [Victivallales bacterium]|nr:hypothetical protein [Victivallales bacterium]
ADIGVYFSSDSKMDFAENGLPVNKAPVWGNNYPHLKAVRGVCRILQQAHLPFTMVTRKDIASLNSYKTIILPNILRMDKEELEAIREYVRQGGRIYASRYTSLTETKGVRHSDFMLADVFGCHCASDDAGKITYLKPCNDETAQAIWPQKYLSQVPIGGQAEGLESTTSGGTLLLDGKGIEGKSLMTLSLPYAAPAMGTIFDQDWASIHSSPPWKDTDNPVIVENSFGKGRSVYSAADIESIDSAANDKLFLSLIFSLQDEKFSYTADTNPAVWMNVFHQPRHNRFIVGFLNYQVHLPAISVAKIPFTLNPPKGKEFATLVLLPGEQELDFTTDKDGVLHAEAENILVFQMLSAIYN